MKNFASTLCLILGVVTLACAGSKPTSPAPVTTVAAQPVVMTATAAADEHEAVSTSAAPLCACGTNCECAVLRERIALLEAELADTKFVKQVSASPPQPVYPPTPPAPAQPIRYYTPPQPVYQSYGSCGAGGCGSGGVFRGGGLFGRRR